MGTSFTVYSVTYYLNHFTGKHLIIINETPTSQDGNAELVIRTGFVKTMTRKLCKF